MYRRPESVLVLVYTRQSHVLLMERADIPGFWQSVTGALKPDELTQHAAARELLEETGINEQPTDHHYSTQFEIAGPWRARYHPQDTHNTEHVFSLRLGEEHAIALNPSEHTDYIWLPVQQAMNKVTSPTNRQAIEKVLLTSGNP